jgi:hypothetical protein
VSKRFQNTAKSEGSNIGEKEEELSALAYGDGNGISGVVEDISQRRLDGSKYGCGTKAHDSSSIK